ncbi:MAG: hypothetical protein KDA28_11620 [Phycisphaerales bacterium]|nr:hypothetical protein [Phycisphaerales bacterium]
MSLTDLMSNMDLSTWPEVALVIFLGVFLAVSIRAARRSPRLSHVQAMLPLDDQETTHGA